MTTTKPRTEVPKIELIKEQTFILTQEEVSLACAEYAIKNRRDTRFYLGRPYTVHASHGTISITIKDAGAK